MQTDTDFETLRIGKYAFRSRLFVGTGKYPSLEVMQQAHVASGAEVVTVAIRRMHLDDKSGKTLVDYIDRERMTLLPNTAGCYTAKDAVLTAKLAREALGTDLIKVEVIGDAETLYPDTRETIAAAEELVREGFTVLPYVVDDPIACKRLEEVGCAAVMPLAAPDRQRPGRLQSVLDPADQGTREGAGHRRRRRRHRVGRGDRDGARRRRGADEHRNRRGERSGAHGARDALRDRSRTRRVSRRPHAAASLRERVEPDAGPHRHAPQPSGA
jgi:hypothetical protein